MDGNGRVIIRLGAFLRLTNVECMVFRRLQVRCYTRYIFLQVIYIKIIIRTTLTQCTIYDNHILLASIFIPIILLLERNCNLARYVRKQSATYAETKIGL